MQTNHTHLQEFTIKNLFTKGDQYLIPVYQRNYEWGKAQIEQLILDVKDYFTEESDKNYYIGTLIVDKTEVNKRIFYETIDGQQRLTTLNIICCALKTLGINIEDYFYQPIIHFESRKNADETIRYLVNNGKQTPNFDNYNVNIHDGLLIACEVLETLKKDEFFDFNGFVKYLFDKVIILRVQVPEDTDLNHYFEIMNSRGEQLEKHEILKSRLMAQLNGFENSLKLRRVFNTIWEACADMNNYIQLNFNKTFREPLFGKSWFHFKPLDFDSIFDVLSVNNSNTKTSSAGLSFGEIVASNSTEINTKISALFDEQITEKENSQFQPVINFENFLLHVLKIKQRTSDISLDDKRLLLFFNNVLEEQSDKAGFVMDFAYQLLKTRFLLDQFVIKRKYEGGESWWSLQVVNYYPINAERKQDSYSFINTFDKEQNDELVMLLSMFHVSTPTLVYKNWLFATLLYLNENFRIQFREDEVKSSQIDGSAFTSELQSIARRFMHYRHLTNRKVDYNDIILNPDDLPDNQDLEYDFTFNLSYGNIDNNLVFNYLDYLLWKQDNNRKSYSDFEFSFRSSVEHYYPQNPISGEKLNSNTLLNCFGNLCLISHGNNSRLSNHLPNAKKEYYTKAATKDSIKQMIMMKSDTWNAGDIEKHHKEMVELLEENLFELENKK